VSEAQPLLELRDVAKHFGGVRAVDGVDLVVRRREVHGLLGENGSGKSTLLKVLSGYHAPDRGTLTVRGEDVPLPLAPGAFRELGLAFVHQDLALVGALTVTENLATSRLAAGGRRTIRWRSERRRAADTLARYGLEAIDPAAAVGELAPMQRALIAIVRAVEDVRAADRDDALLVLDEPTAFLPREGVDTLFRLIRELVAGGASVLLVTHDLDEVREICDRTTVLRDGRNAGTVDTAVTTDERLVELILGVRLEPVQRAAPPARRREVAVRVRGLAGAGLQDLDLDLARGEVVGVTGLLGSGFESVPPLLFGARAGRGQLELDGRIHLVADLTPAGAMRQGVACVPADRPVEGAIGALSVTDNVTMTTLDWYRGWAGLGRGRMRRAAGELAQRFDIRPGDPAAPLATLSGGNQQKAVLAKWLQARPRLLLLQEPTQGVDVGARRQVFAAVRAAAAEGTTVLCASADAEELAELCDRVVVLARGRPVAELAGSAVTKDRITEEVLTSVSMPEILDRPPEPAAAAAAARGGDA
jgi:ribose transport system ATP-binding protein